MWPSCGLKLASPDLPFSTCENETPPKLVQNWSFLDFQLHLYGVLLFVWDLYCHSIWMVVIQPDKQINRFVSIIFIVSMIVSIIIVDI